MELFKYYDSFDFELPKCLKHLARAIEELTELMEEKKIKEIFWNIFFQIEVMK